MVFGCGFHYCVAFCDCDRAVNSAIEEALDLITHEYSTKVKAAKDMGSAAVFILVLVNIFVQSLIYLPELYKLAEYVKLYLNK